MKSNATYELFDPPFELAFDEWGGREARTFFNWFVAHIDERLGVLREFAASEGVRELDLSSDSLYDLGAFFSGHVKGRPKTAREKEVLREEWARRPAVLQVHYDPDREVLNEETISLCFDVGIYLAETLRREHDALRWDLWKHKTVERNRPVIVGFTTSVPLDPFLITTNIAFGTLRRGPQPNVLREVFDTWSRQA